MNNDPYFCNLPNIDDLYLKVSLIVFEGEPILFICKNKLNHLYLCLCSEIRGLHRWIISQTDLDILNKLINQDIDIYTALQSYSNKKIIVESNIDNQERSQLIDFDNIDELDLPKKEVKLKVNEKIKEQTNNLICEVIKKRLEYVVASNIKIHFNNHNTKYYYFTSKKDIVCNSFVVNINHVNLNHNKQAIINYSNSLIRTIHVNSNVHVSNHKFYINNLQKAKNAIYNCKLQKLTVA